jgi:alpha-tubulin suppressor-like RCC1 family protein
VWCWGQNFAGEVGNGEVLKCDDFLENCDPGPVFRPTRVQGVPTVRQISAGGHSTCAVDHDGKVWCWGANELQNFASPPSGRLTQPTLIPLPEPMIDVKTTLGHACTLSTTGHVYCWGYSIERWRKNPVRIQLPCETE